MGKLIVLMVTAFVDMVGLLMLMPIMPYYAKELGANGFVVGLLVAAFSVAQLLSAPVWGRFSDHYGRRPALLIGLGASAIAYVIFAFADSLWLLFLSRIVQGAGGGTVGVIQAYVADAVKPEQRARGLGWLSAATNLGVTLGPVLGSMASVHGRHAPGLYAAALCTVNMVFAWKFLSESRDMVEARAHKPKAGRSREAVWQVLSHSSAPAPRLIWMYAVGMGAFTGVTAILALFLADRFAITEKTIGFFFMYIGAISVVTRVFVLGWAVDRFGEAKLSRVGALLLALGLGSLPFMHPMAVSAAFAEQFGAFAGLLPYLPLAASVALIPLGTAFTFPCVTSLLSRVIPSHERGLYMGMQQTFGGVARVIFPVLAGIAFDWIVPLPFLVSAVLVMGTIALGWGLDAHVREPASVG
jgi:multidrug resistance protein